MRLGALEVPIDDDWEDHSLYSFVAPARPVVPMMAGNPGFQENMVVQPRALTAGEDLGACLAQLRERTRSDLGVTEVKEHTFATASGLEVRRITYRLVDPYNQQPVAQAIYLLLAAGKEWQFAFSVAAHTLEARLKVFDTWMKQVVLAD